MTPPAVVKVTFGVRVGYDGTFVVEPSMWQIDFSEVFTGEARVAIRNEWSLSGKCGDT